MRKQFPIRLCFAMTINKAQRQTIPYVGIYLPEPVFSHGQLYVALSRGVSRCNTKVLVKPNENSKGDGVYTANVVYKETCYLQLWFVSSTSKLTRHQEFPLDLSQIIHDPSFSFISFFIDLLHHIVFGLPINTIASTQSLYLSTPSLLSLATITLSNSLLLYLASAQPTTSDWFRHHHQLSPPTKASKGRRSCPTITLSTINASIVVWSLHLACVFFYIKFNLAKGWCCCLLTLQ
ncbi:unnamed protein product [Lactuca saligna]|uniref:ATP-dependent DNA helicase n=1 Tax=Lactuca saligna TaxID=75948 RepID=A0AA35YEN7_LACSI|nr:unnamed protein product [Lactuca saligna]